MLAGNTPVHYARTGAAGANAPAVLLLHGWARTLKDFDGLAGRLAAVFPGHAFLQIDLPGFGASPLQAAAGYNLDDYCTTLRLFMEKVGVARAVLIGHSLGGRIAVKFAASYPDRVEKLVLIASAGIPPQSWRLTLLGAGRIFFKTVFWAFRDFAFILRLENLLGAIFGGPDYRATATYRPLRETLKKVLAEDLRPDAAQISAPTLLLWGRNDQITPLADGEKYHALIRGSRMAIMEGGHFAFLECQEESAREIISFLQD